jgi:glycosyltransferase involved in cell wall biosynthesis
VRIAFYAPLKSPTHSTPSGDRRVAELLMEALERAGHRVELASTFRSYDRDGDPTRQAALREEGLALGRRLARRWREGPAASRPELWFTYHVYYKAPDWLGPEASAALGIPYVIAEASYAPKRAGGPWAIGHEATADAVRRAALVLSPTRYDVACLEPLVDARDRIVLLPPFLDATPFRAAAGARAQHRARLAAAYRIDAGMPWIVAAAMMRPGDKLASYRALAAALARLKDLPWRLIVAGDGPVRAEVEAAIDAAAPGRAHFLGELGLVELAAVYAASDLCAWPAVNEAYGMALLEAQASGVPVVACALRGVPDVVEDGRTGLLVPPGDDEAMAQGLRALLTDDARRAALGRAAAAFVRAGRSIGAAAERLEQALACVTADPAQK